MYTYRGAGFKLMEARVFYDSISLYLLSQLLIATVFFFMAKPKLYWCCDVFYDMVWR